MILKAPYHAHIYYSDQQRPVADALRNQFIKAASGDRPPVLFVGRMMDKGVGPHPVAQFEIHFLEPCLDEIVSKIEASGLTALVHPLTDDDLADHTHLGRWIGEPLELELELSVLDPPGKNQGIARFGKTDF